MNGGRFGSAGAGPRKAKFCQDQTFLTASQSACDDATMSLPKSLSNEQMPADLVVRPRAERSARLARMARPRLVAKANEFFETCDGSYASFNAFTDTHTRFVLAIRRQKPESQTLGISFVTCLYLAGPTFWTNTQLRCTSVEDADGALLYEVADRAAGFIVRCDTIVIPTYDLTFAHEWHRQLAG